MTFNETIVVEMIGNALTFCTTAVSCPARVWEPVWAEDSGIGSSKDPCTLTEERKRIPPNTVDVQISA
jgi:hypothetical protein